MSQHRKWFVRTSLSGIALAISVSAAVAGDFANALSLQGFTGIMNTPTANVQHEGTMAFWFAKQRDNAYPFEHEENYLFSVGLFPFLEAGGRVAVGLSPSYNNDISAQFKLTSAPFTWKEYPWLPSLAVGSQDVGGTAHFFSTTYLVATEEISRLRLSIGYGFGPDRMDGLFGGAELKAFDWLYFLSEYDAKDTNIGARVVSPDIFGYPAQLQATLKSALNNQPSSINFSIGVQFALGTDWRHRQPPTTFTDTAPTTSFVPSGTAASSAPSGAGASAAMPPAAGASSASSGRGSFPVKAGATDIPATAARVVPLSGTETLRSLRDKLVADGFMNVRVGARGTELLVIEYENARYTRSQLDGMGVALGMVVKYLPNDFIMVRLVPKVQGIKMLQLTIPSTLLGSFFHNAAKSENIGDLIEVTYRIDDSHDVDFLDEASFSGRFRSRLTLAPRLKTFVATEIRPLDYLLSFAPSLAVDLWKGALLNVAADIPVAWSNGFDTEQLDRYRNDPQLESLMLFQAIRPRSDFIISLSGGMITHDVHGTVNEAYWHSKEGNHRLGFLQGFGKDNNENFKRTAYLGSYRYAYAPYDTSLTVTCGSFWDNDRGVRADLTRFFGDTSFSLFYKISRTAYDENYQVGGIRFSFPLTPRRGMKPYPVQVKGPDDWNYRLQTVTKSPSGANSVYVTIGEPPPGGNPASQSYYDRDRLTPEYIKSHLLRVRDAYIRYVGPE